MEQDKVPVATQVLTQDTSINVSEEANKKKERR